MKKQIIVAVLVCGACFALCSCGKNKATTFTTDDIDTFVNSVNGNSGSPEKYVSPPAFQTEQFLSSV